jgi:hypothetical protein
MKSFSTRGNNQVILKFPNGVSVSTVWGTGSYSDNHMDIEAIMNIESIMKQEPLESDTCEFMILEAPYELLEDIHSEFNEYSVGSKTEPYGHVPIDVWIKVLNRLTSYTK